MNKCGRTKESDSVPDEAEDPVDSQGNTKPQQDVFKWFKKEL